MISAVSREERHSVPVALIITCNAVENTQKRGASTLEESEAIVFKRSSNVSRDENGCNNQSRPR